ncbi:interleukin-20 receptor subunit alpha-like isoform X2 [Pleurodeles waltl]
MMQPAHWRWATGTARALCILAALLLLPLQAVSESNHQGCSLPKPRNVHFISRNMAAVVHWFPPVGLGNGALYSVQYKMYGPAEWQYKLECTDINRTWCDLTNETYDYEEQYYARVMATLNGSKCSKWTRTDRFSPITNTKIDPPIVRLSSGDRFISINLSPPEKWKRNSKDKSLYQIFPLVEFKVSILNTKTKSEWNLSGKNSFLNVTKLDPNSTYCVTAESYIPVPSGTSQPSQTVCATTLADYSEGLMVRVLFGYVLPAVLAVLLTSAAIYAVYRYIHIDEQKRPKSLQQLPIEACREKFLTPDINNVISIIVMNDSHPPWKNQDCNITQNGSTVGKNLEEKMPQIQHLGYLLQSQELSSVLHDGQSYNKQQSCPGASSDFEPESQSTLSTEEYGLVLRASDSAPVQEQNDRIQNDTCPAIIAYRSQVNINLQSERTHELNCPQQSTMLSGISPAMTNVDQSINNFLQKQTEAKADEEQCGTIVLDWDRITGRLTIPSLYDLDIESDEEGQMMGLCDQHPRDGLLSKVYVKQASQESTEGEDSCLMQFSGKWNLHVQM